MDITKTLRKWYGRHKSARLLSKALGTVTLADPALAALDAFAGTQTVATADAKLSTEVFPHTEGVLLEVKAGADTGKIHYFLRHRRGVDYNGETTLNFTNNEVSIGDDFRLVGQARFVGADLVPQAGIVGMRSINAVGLYGAVTSPLRGNPLAEILGVLTYGPVHAESVHWVTSKGVAGSLRSHYGWSPLVDKLTVGVAGELDYAPRTISYRAGLFLKLTD